MQAISNRVEQLLRRAVAEQRIVGAIAYVMQDGELVHHAAVGLADREAGRAMTAATPHRLASITKPIVAAAALALVDRGRLVLDQPVTRWLPGFRPRHGDAAPPITIHQLLTHTSGLGYTFLEPPDGPYHAAGIAPLTSDLLGPGSGQGYGASVLRDPPRPARRCSTARSGGAARTATRGSSIRRRGPRRCC